MFIAKNITSEDTVQWNQLDAVCMNRVHLNWSEKNTKTFKDCRRTGLLVKGCQNIAGCPTLLSRALFSSSTSVIYRNPLPKETSAFSQYHTVLYQVAITRKQTEPALNTFTPLKYWGVYASGDTSHKPRAKGNFSEYIKLTHTRHVIDLHPIACWAACLSVPWEICPSSPRKAI